MSAALSVCLSLLRVSNTGYENTAYKIKLNVFLSKACRLALATVEKAMLVANHCYSVVPCPCVKMFLHCPTQKALV